MNRLFVMSCMAILLFCHTSCQDGAEEFQRPSVELEKECQELNVQRLVQQARDGNADAYMTLALCYKDGEGVGTSMLNMMFMYIQYCIRTGARIDGIKDFFDKDDPFLLVYDMLELSSLHELSMAKLEALKQLNPAEAKAIEAAMAVISLEEAKEELQTLREAEKEGSEMAVIFQALYYNKAGCGDAKDFFAGISGRYPFANLFLCEMYADEYSHSKDPSFIYKAIECCHKAESNAMLVPKYASMLAGLYEYCEENGLSVPGKLDEEKLNMIISDSYK